MLELSHINKELLYKVLATPSFSEKELRLQEFLMEYASQKDYECSIDDKGNIYMAKGKLSDGCFYPCVTAHMDTVQDSQVVFIDKDEHLPLITESREDGKHIIYTEGFGLGGDDKAGIVIALSIMDNTPICKAVFFVEEEIGCRGSSNCELPWFRTLAISWHSILQKEIVPLGHVMERDSLTGPSTKPILRYSEKSSD